MFDIFYSGIRPNLFAHEQAVQDIDHARQLSRTRYFWWTNYLTDYSRFDFLFEPVPWESDQCHAWPSQWQKDSGTYLIPKIQANYTNYHKDLVLKRLPTLNNWVIPEKFDTNSFDFSWHPDATDPPFTYQFPTQHQRTGGPRYYSGSEDIKYVDQIRGSIKLGLAPIVEIDHLCGNHGQVPGVDRTVRYFDNYRDTLARISRTAASEYLWITSSICDYSKFDFSWHPDQWQQTMLHVFASDGEKFGDTFYMHVPSFKERIGQVELLDWYDINFVGTSVPRRPLPQIRHELDTHVQAIQTQDWPGPLAVFTVQDHECAIPAVPLWREKTKAIVPLSPGASTVIVPKSSVPYIQTQAYDYPYIDRRQRHVTTDKPLDIVFIDNGEPNADYIYQHLCWAAERANNIRIHRSSGVNGRVAAYRAAAELSTTPWFFAVFAKLWVAEDFDWTWQPDRLQEPKHYIFHALNPVNGLIYGHQAMIAYNKKLVLENTATGLDFTLDQAHEVVPIMSGTAMYDKTPWMAWRTAFRECIKLKCNTDIESEYRLEQWLTKDNTEGQWSQKGAEDAVEYYASVAGDFAELKKSYDWAWLSSYAFLKRSLVAT